jgi:hypothetical protein
MTYIFPPMTPTAAWLRGVGIGMRVSHVFVAGSYASLMLSERCGTFGPNEMILSPGVNRCAPDHITALLPPAQAALHIFPFAAAPISSGQGSGNGASFTQCPCCARARIAAKRDQHQDRHERLLPLPNQTCAASQDDFR